MSTYNAVCFFNDGEFDRRSFTMMGLSAKQTDNPIGFFGTGFKYAIATLLRHGLKVRITHHDVEYNFHTAPATFRDQEFNAIYCSFGNVDDDFIELPFTTHLGANWKLWQAYRELYTNVKDERGAVMLAEYDEEGVAGDVCIFVGGDDDRIKEFIDIYNKHDKYFLDQLTLAEGHRMRCVEKKHDSDNVVYYKTMYTGTKLDKPTYFTYDYVSTQSLTEDRTLGDTWYIREHIGSLWSCDMSYDMLVEHLPQVANGKYYENNLDVGYNPPSADFIKACAYLTKHHMSMPMWARDLYTKQLPFDKQIEPYKPTRHQRTQLKKAIAILHHHRVMIAEDRIVLCVSLPEETLGYYKDDVMYIAKQAFEAGFEKLLGTLYEEHVHMVEHTSDMTRKMQNILIDRIASLMLEVYEMEDDNGK